MRHLALFVLVVLAAGDAGARDRACRPDRFGRLQDSCSAALGCGLYSRVRMGAACSSTQPQGLLFGAASLTLATTRGSVAECMSTDGQTITQVPANIARVMSGRTDDPVLGILWEPTATNDIWPSRDLSSARFVKSNVTCVHTANGMRGGDANGASACIATANNGTITYSVTRAATGACFSAYVKRRGGVGAISFARDGSTFVDVSAQMSSGNWRRVVGNDAIGTMGGSNIIVPGLCASTLNPSLVIKIGTSGDSLDVDFMQEEVSAGASPWATMPIETTVGAVTRNGEIHDLVVNTLAATFPTYSTSASMVVPASRAVVTTGLPRPHGVFGVVATPGAGTLSQFTDSYELLTRFFVAEDSKTNSPFDSATGLQITETPATTRATTFYDGAKLNGCVGGLCGAGTARTFTAIDRNVIRLGSWTATDSVLGGVIKRVCLDPRATTAGCIEAAPVAAWVGDSIVAGVGGGVAYAPPWQLEQRLSAGVTNVGTAGNIASQCATAYTNSVAGQGYRTLIWSCGVNDFIAGTTGAAVWATTQVPLDAAVAAGMHVIITQVMPWGGYAGWTSNKQIQSDAYGTLALAWAATNHQAFIYTKPTMGVGGGDVLLPAFESWAPDGVHPGIPGQIELARLAQGGFW